jgi:hypothetical protein
MKTRRGKLVIPEMGKTRKEYIRLMFTKAGVEQQWNLFFNKGKLLTDVVYTSYCYTCYLRSVEHCKTLEDVIEFLKTWAYSMDRTTISGPHKQLTIVEEVGKYNINPYKLNGVLYWGIYTYTFTPGYVHFLRSGITDDGTHKIHGIRHLLGIVKLIGGSVGLDFVKKLKEIEID